MGMKIYKTVGSDILFPIPSLWTGLELSIVLALQPSV